MRPGLSSGVIITDKIDEKTSGRSQHRAERTTLPKYYAGECDYSERQFHPVSGEAQISNVCLLGKIFYQRKNPDVTFNKIGAP